MKDVFDNEPSLEEVTESQGEPEVQHAEPVTDERQEPRDVAPPATDTAKQVPLKALEAERAQRREWRDKYQHLQGQFDAMQRMQQNVQQPQGEPQHQVDPVAQAVDRAENARLDMSEMIAREKFGDEEVDKAFKKLQDASQSDPGLFQRVMRDKNPWVAVVKEAKRLDLLEQMGDDPMTYEQKLKEKWLAEQTQPPVVAPRAAVPASLAGSRSSAARTAPAFTGEPSFKDLF